MVIIIFETWSSLSLKHGHHHLIYHLPNPHYNQLAPIDKRTKSLTHHQKSARENRTLLCLNV